MRRATPWQSREGALEDYKEITEDTVKETVTEVADGARDEVKVRFLLPILENTERTRQKDGGKERGFVLTVYNRNKLPRPICWRKVMPSVVEAGPERLLK